LVTSNQCTPGYEESRNAKSPVNFGSKRDGTRKEGGG